MELTDLPRKIPLSLYDETREAVRHAYKNINGVVDVIEYGGISYPGISDMDFIVVVEPGAEVSLPSLNTYTEDQRYIMEHGHYIMSSDCIRHVKLFDPFVRTFSSLFGKYSIDDLEQLSDEEQIVFSLVHPLTNWILPLLTLFAKIDCAQTIPCRSILTAIKRSPFCHEVFHLSGFINDAKDPYGEDFRFLLDQWFELSETEKKNCMDIVIKKLKIFTKRFTGIAHRELKKRIAARDVPNHLKKNHRFLKDYPNSLCIVTKNEASVFSENTTDTHAEFSIFSSPFTSQVYENSARFIHLIFGAPDIRFLFEEGTFPSYMQKNCYTDLDTVPVFTHPILQKRTGVINALLNDLRNVRGGKLIGRFYGIDVGNEPSGGTLRARIGGIYDRHMRYAINTPFACFFPSKKGCTHL